MTAMLKDKEFRPLYIMILVMIACIILTMAMVGCKTKYIATEPVIVHERDSIVKVNTIQVHDTLHTRDSIYHFVKGDSTIIERWHYVNNINRVNITDTVYQDKIKEIPIPYPKPYPVEKELSRFQRFKMDLGAIAMGAMGLLLVGGVVWIFRRKLLHFFK